jgi:hypothetical protein
MRDRRKRLKLEEGRVDSYSREQLLREMPDMPSEVARHGDPLFLSMGVAFWLDNDDRLEARRARK